MRRGQLWLLGTQMDLYVCWACVSRCLWAVALTPANEQIRLWNMEDLNLVTGRHGSGTGLMCTLNGHRGVVSTVHFNANGSQLVSGGADTDVVMWDVVGRAGLFRCVSVPHVSHARASSLACVSVCLCVCSVQCGASSFDCAAGMPLTAACGVSARLRGHRDQVTDAVFFAGSKRLITSSKDTLLKVWDLDTQHCIQTCVGHRTEVWSMSMNRDETRLATGSGDSQLRIWKVSAAGTLTPQTVDGDAEGAGVEESKQGAAVIPTGQRRIQDAGLSASQAAVVSEKVHLELFGSLGRPVSQRVQTVRYSRDGSLLLCQVRRWRVCCVPFCCLLLSFLVPCVCVCVCVWKGCACVAAMQMRGRVTWCVVAFLLLCHRTPLCWAGQGAGKTVEVYRTRSEDGAKKKFNRRRKRAREKARAMQEAFEQAKAHKASSAVLAEAQEKAEAAAAAVEAVTEVPTDEFELVTVRCCRCVCLCTCVRACVCVCVCGAHAVNTHSQVANGSHLQCAYDVVFLTVETQRGCCCLWCLPLRSHGTHRSSEAHTRPDRLRSASMVPVLAHPLLVF